jgi:two-component system LytT family response regulator
MPQSPQLQFGTDGTILIVEDELPARTELKRMLVALGIKVRIMEAASITEALSTYKEHRPDLIFLDIQMPGGSGFDLLKNLGAERSPVIFTTAYEQFAAKAFDEEAVDYLLKPFDKKRLARALSRLPLSENPDRMLTAGDKILLKLDGECILLPVESIDLFETTGNTTHVFWSNRSGKINKPLKHLAKKFDASFFFRASRYQLLNLKNVLLLKTNDDGLVEALLPQRRLVTFSRRQSILFRKTHAL